MSSVLRPQGVPIVLGEVERHFLFTLNAIDEIQSHYDMTMMDVFKLMSDDTTLFKTVKYLTHVLLTDEFEREKFRNPDTDLKPISEKEAGWLVTKDNIVEVSKAFLVAYGLSMPEADEDDDPNVASE